MAKKKFTDYYEYKEAPIRQALNYAAFGWLIGKRSQHYSKKLGQDVVTLRRDLVIGNDPTISDYEKEYLYLEKGKLPRKYRSHVFLSFLGKSLLTILTAAVLVFGLLFTFVGLYDAMKVGKRTWAVYNAAVETEIVAGSPIDASGAVPDAYYDFLAKNPTVDTFAELLALAGDKVDEDVLLESYKDQLVKFKLADQDEEKSFVGVDATLNVGDDGKYPADSGLGVMLDPVRSWVYSLKLGSVFSSFPSIINVCDALGIALVLIFIIMIIIESAVRRHNKKELKVKCAYQMKECLKLSSNALYNLKADSRELMTGHDRHIYDLERMFTQVMASQNEEND